ncbi:MAG: DUF4422 domain-containing protein [[Clostridium] sporosphaeroides]|uniref:DUF4422 domain-containing protein n=1 Tax=Faecalispora sporosphaeroides TaxID=1549 RepID=A0A928Q4R4_9FIRM|nr:DUF4422 domain-containing protein [Faecalispora sporosphaeroides]
MRFNLYIVHHKDVKIPVMPCMIPIRSDRADQENLSTKENYCELRAQYWVWKNVALRDDDYIGFFHYRRYLDFSKGKALSLPIVKRPLPYRISRFPVKKTYAEENIADCVEGFDVIAPVWEYTGISVWQRYSQSPKQRREDLQLVYNIIQEKYPQFIPAADAYLAGNGEYYGNIFLMRWSLFKNYCLWLFDILEEFDNRVALPLPRTNGYLGERLFGIYFTWLQEQTNLNLGELPRLHFLEYDDERHAFAVAKIINCFLPPGSVCRAQVVRKANNIMQRRSRQ